MRIKKRLLIPLFLLFCLYLITRLEFFAFRTSPDEQMALLTTATQITPTVTNYTINHQTIHYTHIGDIDLPLLVLVHGSPGSSSAFMEYLKDERLLEKLQLLAVDRPGFGYSDYGKAESSLAMQAKALLPLLKKYRSGKTILLGHSFGGPLIARMAMDFPELVEGMVIVAGSLDPDLEPKEWWRKPMNWLIIRGLLPPALRVCNQEILPLEGELRKMMPFWEKITVPVTVIQGEKDKLVPKENADFAKKMLVNSKAVKIDVVEGGNHFILWSLQDRVVDAILAIL